MASYADIVEIVAPSQALSGDQVNITVRIKNLYSAPIGIMVAGVIEVNGTPQFAVSFSEYSANVDGGVTYSFAGSFAMPGSRCTVHAYSYWYGGDGYWHQDDDMTKTVELQSLSPGITEFRIADFIRV